MKGQERREGRRERGEGRGERERDREKGKMAKERQRRESETEQLEGWRPSGVTEKGLGDGSGWRGGYGGSQRGGNRVSAATDGNMKCGDV